MSNLLTGHPSRVITVSLGLLLFTVASLTPLLAQITPSGDAYTNTALPTTNFGDKPSVTRIQQQLDEPEESAPAVPEHIYHQVEDQWNEHKPN